MPKETWGDLIEKVMKKEHPLYLYDLYGKVKRLAVAKKGFDTWRLEHTVRSVLGSDPRFKRVGQGEWDLSGKSKPKTSKSAKPKGRMSIVFDFIK
jgi:hypothetical protein